MLDSILKKECDLKYFHDNGYARKKCKSCNDYYWTLEKNSELCGDQPCVSFSFIGDSTTTDKKLSLDEVRQKFISFFKNNNHSKVSYPETGNRCPVIARWRNDIYLTIASIADFQPHVTSGEVPPPSNPLVISQPCIRLNDLDEVGFSGRHLTMFEMMGHHAFNKNIDEIYWKEKTVEYCDEFFTKEIGIPRNKINYKEQLWIGGGNAGPCIEVLAGGLEIATLVFMNMKEDDDGDIEIEGKKYVQNPLNIVDTGYGLERIAWFTTGTKTIYETVFPKQINFIKNKSKNKNDISAIYALADHSKCLAFMLGDGIVPSNVKSGYLARLIIRRSLRFLEKLDLNISLKELVNLQLDQLKISFPSLIERKKQINEILDIETNRFKETLSKGRGMVKRILLGNEKIDTGDLIKLYDTHGMPPDVVKNISEKEGVKIEIPKNFDTMIAELHSHEKKLEAKKEVSKNLPETGMLYYEDHYKKEFYAKVIWANKIKDNYEIILDKTAFYPEGGGQPNDVGFLLKNNDRIFVKKVKKIGNTIIHVTDKKLKVGDEIKGLIDWDKRYTLMKHHTGTHVINGALRKILGEHVWQAGSQLGINEARFDFSHYESLNDKDVKAIEKMSNEFIQNKVNVEKKIMTRNDAEKTFGFRLYQGGVPPGNEIRVLNIPGIDVEACGGTHLDNIGEIEKVRIIKSERIQDGVNRIIFAAGKMVDKHIKEDMSLFRDLVNILEPYYQIKSEENASNQLKISSEIFSVPKEQLNKTIKRFLNESDVDKKIIVEDLVEACEKLFNQWKKSQKKKKQVTKDQIEIIKNGSEKIPNTDIRIVATTTSSESNSTAIEIVKDGNFIAHIYDGKKLTSAASENVDIDLRKIAPEIGKMLGGSGGGKEKLTQSGGPNKDKIKDVLEKAKKLTINMLKR